MAIADKFHRVAQRCAAKLGQEVVIDDVTVNAIVDEEVQFVRNSVTATVMTVSVPKSVMDKPDKGVSVSYDDVTAEVLRVEPEGPDWVITLRID